MSHAIRLALNSAFKTQSLAEQVALAKIISEGEAGLDEVRAGAWSQMVAAIVRTGSPEGVNDYFKEFETAYKADTNEKKMPGWYRSNKSVASKALLKAVELLDNEGFPLGKSAVEAACKEEESGKTPIERIVKAFGTISTNLEHDDFAPESDIPTIKRLIADLNKRLEEV